MSLNQRKKIVLSVRWSMRNMLGLLACLASLGCHGGFTKRDVAQGTFAPASPTFLLNSASASQADAFRLTESTADAGPVLLDLNGCLTAGLLAFRHELGLQTVLVDAPYAGGIKVVLPPGLDRGEQIQVHQAIQARVLEIHLAYRNFVASYRLRELQQQERRLRGELGEAIQAKVDAGQATVIEQHEIELADIEFELSALTGYRNDGNVPAVEAAALSLVALCQLPGSASAYVPTGISNERRHLLDAGGDVDLVLRRNPELVLRRYQWYVLQRQAKTRPDSETAKRWCLGIERPSQSTSLELPITAFDLLAEEERRYLRQVLELRGQISALQQAMELNQRQQAVLREQRTEAEEGLAKKQLSRDDLLRVDLAIITAEKTAVRFERDLSLLFDRYWHQCGLLCELAGIDFPDYWLSASHPLDAHE